MKKRKELLSTIYLSIGALFAICVISTTSLVSANSVGTESSNFKIQRTGNILNFVDVQYGELIEQKYTQAEFKIPKNISLTTPTLPSNWGIYDGVGDWEYSVKIITFPKSTHSSELEAFLLSLNLHVDNNESKSEQLGITFSDTSTSVAGYLPVEIYGKTKYYTVVNTNIPLAEADNSSIARGGRLAIFSSNEELELVVNSLNLSVTNQYWIGSTDAFPQANSIAYSVGIGKWSPLISSVSTMKPYIIEKDAPNDPIEDYASLPQYPKIYGKDYQNNSLHEGDQLDFSSQVIKIGSTIPLIPNVISGYQFRQFRLADGTDFGLSHIAIDKTSMLLEGHYVKESKVTVKYINQDGQEIHSSQVILGTEEQAYDTSSNQYQLVIDGYNLDKNQLPQNISGYFGNGQEVTYIYNKSNIPTSTLNPSTPKRTKATINTIKSGTNSSVKKLSGDEYLPKTGEKSSFSEIMVGASFLVLGGAMILLGTKRSKKDGSN